MENKTLEQKITDLQLNISRFAIAEAAAHKTLEQKITDLQFNITRLAIAVQLLTIKPLAEADELAAKIGLEIKEQYYPGASDERILGI